MTHRVETCSWCGREFVSLVAPIDNDSPVYCNNEECRDNFSEYVEEDMKSSDPEWDE